MRSSSSDKANVAISRLLCPSHASESAVFCALGLHLPDGKDTASLSETRLLLDTTDALLEDRRDLSWCGLVGVASSLQTGDDGGCGISDL
jgi:hypothetical protein